jgi:hypothetical protein
MSYLPQASTKGRREFLQSVIPAGCVMCLFQSLRTDAASALPLAATEVSPDPDSDSHWTYRQVYEFAFQGWMIPQLESLASLVGGREALTEMLRTSSLTLGRRTGEASGLSDFDSFVEYMRGVLEESAIYKNCLSWDRFEVTDHGLEIRFTSCLWAQTFRGAEASDFGYAAVCHQDVGWADALGSFLAFERPSTLMQGGEGCVFRYLKR